MTAENGPSVGRLAGKVALVSGAGQGIGRAIAERLAADGARVAVNDLDPDTAAATARAVDGLAVPFDASSPDAVDAGVARVEAELGPVDLLVSDHAYMTMTPFLDTPWSEFERHLDVNLVGTALLVARVLPGMRERRYGRIVAIASEWGQIGWPNASAYSASKGGIIAYVKSVAAAVARDGVAVNAVAPGVTDTPQLDVDADDAGLTHDEMARVYGEGIPLGRIGRPAEIAAAVAFLLTEPAIALVGQVVAPNGGPTRV